MYADVYILAPERTRKLVYEFLEMFLPQYSEQSPIYEVFDNNTLIAEFNYADTLMNYLELHTNISYGIYWATKYNTCIGAPFANAFFTNDHQLILGIGCYPEEAENILEKMMLYFGNQNGYITYEMPPPSSAKEFLDIVKSFH